MNDDERRDRSEPIDLGAWTAPPPPRDLAARVIARLRAEGGDRDDGAVPVGPAIHDEPARRARWPRYLAVAAGGAAIAAAATWALVARPGRKAAAPMTGAGVATATATAAATESALDLGDGVTAIASPGAVVRWRRAAGDAHDPRAEITVTQTSGTVDYRSRGDARLRLNTPLGLIDTLAAPVRLSVSPMPLEEDPMNRKALALGGAAALVATGVVIVVYQGQARVRPTAGPTQAVAAGQQVALPANPPTRAPVAPTLVAHATRDRGLRVEVAAAIAAAQARRAARVAGAATGAIDAGTTAAIGPGTVDPPDLPLSRDEIRQGVREVAPMLGDCFQQELLDRGVDAEGSLVVHLVVETEPDVGTVVVIDDQQPPEMDFHARMPDGGAPRPLLRDSLASFNQCVQLTLESVVLPPMKTDGRLAITYPFSFAPGDGTDDGTGDGSDGVTRRTPTPMTPLREAEAAARLKDWAVALDAAERALAGRLDPTGRTRAVMIAGLAACNTRNRGKALAYYSKAAPGYQTFLRQSCLKKGIEPAL